MSVQTPPKAVAAPAAPGVPGAVVATTVWWKSQWFYIAVGLVILLLLFFGIRSWNSTKVIVPVPSEPVVVDVGTVLDGRTASVGPNGAAIPGNGTVVVSGALTSPVQTTEQCQDVEIIRLRRVVINPPASWSRVTVVADVRMKGTVPAAATAAGSPSPAPVTRPTGGIMINGVFATSTRQAVPLRTRIVSGSQAVVEHNMVLLDTPQELTDYKLQIGSVLPGGAMVAGAAIAGQPLTVSFNVCGAGWSVESFTASLTFQ